MNRVGFRARLLVILALFAVVPAAIVTAAYTWSVPQVVRAVSGAEAWERVAKTGSEALDVAERNAASAEDLAKIRAHRDTLSNALRMASRLEVFTQAFFPAAVLLAVAAILLLGIATVRVAGHLSRQLSRPLQELVGWTEMMARGEKLPDSAGTRGAPEFEILRQRMRLAERELGRSRERALEAERLRAFRESARQVAHELKNMLTPIRFALTRLGRDADPSQRETLAVLNVETTRMEEIARNFSLFGKLPEGPEADIDLAELVTYTARATVEENGRLSLDIGEDLPPVRGHHDALSRALSNVLLNAVDASPQGGGIRVRVRRSDKDGSWIDIEVSDEGHGIDPAKLETIWDPYVTYKNGGTGLGLAITRQTIEAHGGRVHARSNPGSGTVITFQLPSAPRPSAVPSASIS